ncbi:protein of unknown function [Taphrina deformans PYCC 5710]|uniref:PLC-like phosphodiesterase n=1 Tax=Taphrina deformans (strain PYCC 5710 / ATCC 11124 / CBS 356.35 / IMI 108563 / JCM 9778 / NBRC 8474) TaxID=1097556 RepID=R4XL51_TAPDE|nr:protein of unknown function [Taphrina deformans PYCC 5710]|eukprot:CCG84039.1 protein of unknown function [Taphrina deformans PYCC 5710]
MLGSASGQLCNGYSAYCSKRYSDISFTGAHDSAFVRTAAFDSLFGNQFYPVTTQLDSGIRMLQGQVHSSSSSVSTNTSFPSGIELCHSSCGYPGSDFGPLETYLSDVRTWLDRNPREVITILWVNGGFAPTTWESAYASTGLLRYVYRPPDRLEGVLTLSDWPTLQDLISNDTRVINFIDTGADTTAVPWLLDEFSNVWETGYDETSADQFSCTLDRPYASQPQSTIPASQKLYLINHFLDYEIGTTGIDVPNVTYASITNSVSGQVGSLSAQVSACTASNGRPPNFLLVDFFDQGNGSSVAAAAVANGVQYRAPALFPGAFPVPGSDNHTSALNATSSNAASVGVASTSLVPTAQSSGSGTRTLSATVAVTTTTFSHAGVTVAAASTSMPSSTLSSSAAAAGRTCGSSLSVLCVGALTWLILSGH